MSKLILTGHCTAALGLGASGYGNQAYRAANSNFDVDKSSYADNAADHNSGIMAEISREMTLAAITRTTDEPVR
jgi:hypothetical protein